MVQTINQLQSRVMVLETVWFNALRQQNISIVPFQRHPFQPAQAQNHGIVQIANDAQSPNDAPESDQIEVIDVGDATSE